MTDTNISEYLKSDKASEPRPLSEAMARRRPNFKDAAPKDPHFRPHVPIDYHADSLTQTDTIAYAKGHKALSALWAVHTQILESVPAIKDRALLAKQIEPTVLKTIKAAREEVAGLDRQIEHANTEIAKALGQGVGAIASETRAVVRSLPEKERFAFVRELVAARDIESLKAIAAVSPFLSGISKDVYDFARSETERMVAANYVTERDTGMAARDKLDRAVNDFDETMANNIKRWRASDEQKVATLLEKLTPKKEGE